MPDTQRSERRRAPRVPVLSRVCGQVVVLNLPMTVFNLSVSGFLMQAPVPLTVGTVHAFRFTVDEIEVTLEARIARVLTAHRTQGHAYVHGCEFVDTPHGAHHHAIARLLTIATADPRD